MIQTYTYLTKSVSMKQSYLYIHTFPLNMIQTYNTYNI